MNFKYWYLRFKEIFVKYKVRRNLLLGGTVCLIGNLLSGSVSYTTSSGVLWLTFIIELTLLWAFGDFIKFTKANRIELINYLKTGDKKLDNYINLIVEHCCEFTPKSIQMDEVIEFEDKLFIDIGCFRLYIRRDKFRAPSIAYKKVIGEDEIIVEKYNTTFHSNNTVTHSDKPKKEWEIENAFKNIQEIVHRQKQDESVFIYPNTDHYTYLKHYLIKFVEYNPNSASIEFERLLFELGG